MQAISYRVPFIGALLLLLVLGACAPATAGGSVRQPLELGRETVEVNPGTSVYLLTRNSLKELGFREGELDVVQFVSETASRSSGRADPWMGLEPVRVPVGWNVSLATARFVHEAGEDITVQSVIRVDVPAGADLGPVQLRLELQGRRSPVSLTVPLRVRFGSS